MKNLFLSVLLFAVCTSTAFAADKVALVVQLMEGDKLLTSAAVTTIDGQPAPISIGSDHTYIASATKEGDKVTITPGVVRDGFSMTVIPTLTKNGKIEVEFVATKTELTAINKFKQGDVEVQLPQVNSMNIKQKVALGNGKGVAIPFGPVIKPEKDGEAVQSQYTIKLVATKI